MHFFGVIPQMWRDILKFNNSIYCLTIIVNYTKNFIIINDPKHLFLHYILLKKMFHIDTCRATYMLMLLYW